MLEAFDLFLFEFFFCFGPDGGIVGGAIFDHMPENAHQFVGHGSDRLWSPEPCFPTAEAFAQIVLAAHATAAAGKLTGL